MSKKGHDLKREELVLVKWRDTASSGGGWKDAEEVASWIKGGQPCETAGWIVSVDAKGLSVIVASSFDEETESVIHLMRIRMENITEIRRLNVGANISKRFFIKHGLEFVPD
jgi:hypothetical protein